MSGLRAPFPYFGGKSRVADTVWRAFGDVPNYVEPFAGSLAVLLARPHAARHETINDLDCHVANFWRASQAEPEAVAKWAHWPINEADLHARHLSIVQNEEFRERMKTDPEHYDVKVAGWWLWGLGAWLGGGWCIAAYGDGRRPSRRIPRPGEGVHADKLRSHDGQKLTDYMASVKRRIHNTRIICGDWTRALKHSVTGHHGTCAIFLDPPYDDGDAAYAAGGQGTVSAQVREWAIENGGSPDLRIALCGYDGEHGMPSGWRVHQWRAQGGYAHLGDSKGKNNRHRERIWFSPACLPFAANESLFDRLDDEQEGAA